jgi:stearoyl-CoA desaturase (delta-9 desaturase)
MKSYKIHWESLLFVGGYHLLLLIALPIYFFHGLPSAGIVGMTAALVFISGVAITAGYHRLYSHQTYKIHPAAEAVLLFFATIATQGSALRWCFNHRNHHAFVDTDRDPYSIKKGFWHAHIWWMFKKWGEIDPKVVADLKRNKMLEFQHKHYASCMVLSNLAVFLFAGWLCNDYWGAFVFVWFVRIFVLHHTTWFINSLAHYWGHQRYSEEHSAVDNYFLCVLTYGEGYHNYHHTFAQDYRIGIRWYHFDPGKWLIWSLSKVGLARDLKKASDFRIVRQLVSEHKGKLLKALHESLNLGLEKKVAELGDRLLDRLATLQSLYDRYKKIPRQEAHILRDQIRATKKEWKNTWKEWKRIIKIVNQIEPLVHSH